MKPAPRLPVTEETTMEIVGIELGSAVFIGGVLFLLAGGEDWLKEKTRQLELENDALEAEIEAKKKARE